MRCKNGRMRGDGGVCREAAGPILGAPMAIPLAAAFRSLVIMTPIVCGAAARAEEMRASSVPTWPDVLCPDPLFSLEKNEKQY